MASQEGILSSLRRRLLTLLVRTVFSILLIPSMRSDNHLATTTYAATPETISIPSRDPSRKIKAFLHTPPTGPSKPGAPKPVVINWHGSGWTINMLGSDVALCARLAKDVDAYVIDADYRKAPENPFPAAIDDVRDVLDWIATQSSRFDISRVAVGGASAGGTMALIAASTFRKDLKLDIKAVLARYPAADLSLGPKDRVVPNPVLPLPSWLLGLFTTNYCGKNVRLLKDPRVSPMYAPVEAFPETVVMVTCSGDTLAPEAQRLAEKLDDGKRKVVRCVLEGMNHGFDVSAKRGTKLWDCREETFRVMVASLEESFRKG